MRTAKSTRVKVDEQLFFLTAERGKKLLAEILRKEFNLSTTSCAILSYLKDGKTSVQKLAAGILAQQSNVSQRINFLVKKKMLCKIANRVDRRTVEIELTKIGRDFLRKFEKSKAKKMEKLDNFLSSSELKKLDKILRKLNCSMGKFCAENKINLNFLKI